ncbi:MAG: ferritin-like protein [Nostocaceae cyanobacterium]|nr:ferritin-like protein [Nostocaceae cyanobacterium]
MKGNIAKRLIYKAISSVNSIEESKQQLQEYLQYAVILEFATIPPYLTALYSLKDKSSDAYQVIRSVAIEEMLHINLVSNLMNAIGSSPKFVGQIASYPATLLPPVLDGPRVQLMAASTELMQKTFMAIEQPGPLQQPEEGQPFKTIGQFYGAIEKLFEDCVNQYGEAAVFTGDPSLQRIDYYFGSGSGKPIKVENLATAKEAIQQIMQQGEGAAPPTAAYRALQPWGAYNRYGNRNDGTYGPILGTPYELSHYFKFKAIADGKIPLPSVYPMLPNPSSDKFTNPKAQQLVTEFNNWYGVLVRTLEQIFSSNVTPDPYFTVVVKIMQSVFPTLATELMQTPVLEDGDADLGPTAAPTFEYSDTPLEEIERQISQLIEEGQHSQSMRATLKKVKEAAGDILGKLEGSELKKRL